MQLLIFIYSMMGLLICKYEPFWQEVSVKSPLYSGDRQVGLLFLKLCLKILFSRTAWPITTKLDTKYLLVKDI